MLDPKKKVLGLICILLILFMSLSFISANDDNEENRYIIQVRENSSLDNSLKNKVVEEVKDPVSLSRKQIASAKISISKPKTLVVKNVDEKILREDSSIVYIEQDYIVKSLGEENPWNLETIGFDISNINNLGDGVRIAILDTGSNNKNVISGYDFVNEDNDVFDDNGHGTSVSKILKSSNGGFPLVNAKIYSVKVLNDQGAGYVSDVIEGINWAIDNDIDIVLMSFGGNGNSLFLEQAINEAYNDGLLFIAAAGNTGNNIIAYPAAYNLVCSVGSVNQNLEKSQFSSYGDALEFVAPGENLYIEGSNLKGTSFSVPHVAIVASSIFSENPGISNSEVRSLLQKDSLDLGATGKDQIFGYGLPIIQNSQEINFTPLDYPNNNIEGFDLKNVIRDTPPSIFSNVKDYKDFVYSSPDLDITAKILEFNDREELIDNLVFEEVDLKHAVEYGNNVYLVYSNYIEWVSDNKVIHIESSASSSNILESGVFNYYADTYPSDLESVSELSNSNISSFNNQFLSILATSTCEECGAGIFNNCDKSECYNLGNSCYLGWDACLGVGDCNCYDGSSLQNGNDDFCNYKGQRADGCLRNEYDCDSDSQCSSGLVCLGPIGGAADGCCNVGDTWNTNTFTCQAPTSINSVTWSTSNSNTGDTVTLSVSTSGFQNGQVVEFEIWEDDGLGRILGDDYIRTLTTTISNNFAQKTWVVENGDDGFGNLEYYFVAKIGGKEKVSTTMNTKFGYNGWDCDATNQCSSGLICEGVPAGAIGGGGFSGDGCCYANENWNIDDQFCNKAIIGQVFDVTSLPSGNFSSKYFSNIQLVFVGTDVSALIGKIFNYQFYDSITTDSLGRFNYNPELNRANDWNSNILFNFKLEVYAIDSSDNLIAKWSNSYTNDNEDYKLGRNYVDQRVRIHTDKPYWKDISLESPFEANAFNSLGSNNKPLSEKEEQQIILIKSKINLKRDSDPLENVSLMISSASTNQEEVLYALWKGRLIIEDNGDYQFNTSIEGSYKLTIDDKVIIDTLFSENSGENNPINLEKGKHNLTIEYINLMDRAAPNLLWKTGSGNFNLVPSVNLAKESLEFQYYTMNEQENVEPISKFKQTNSDFSIASSDFKTANVDSTPYQVSFLEAPRKTININKEPLVLVHGLHGESGYFNGFFEDELVDEGYDVWKFYYPNDQKISYSGVLFSDGLEYTLSQYNVDKANIISHSMGGLVTRSYIEDVAKDPNNISTDYKNNVDKFVMLGSPNNGAYLANRVQAGEDLGLVCEVASKAIGWILFNKAIFDIDPSEPAYEDLAVGSDFLWDLNYNTSGINNSIEISGKRQDIPCIPFEADQSDDFVSVVSSSLLDKNTPLVIMNENHASLFKKIELWEKNFWDVILNHVTNNAWSYILRPIIEGYLDNNYNPSDVLAVTEDYLAGNNFLSHLSPGESYISGSSSNVAGKGMVYIKFRNKEEVEGKLVSLNNGQNNFELDPNIKSGIYYHFNYNDNAGDYGLTIPSGNYSLIVDGEDTLYDIKIKPLKTTFYELTLCTPNWTLEVEWGTCQSNDLQFKNHVDLNSCGFDSTKPEPISQSCDFCFPNWTEEKSSCLSGDKRIGTFNDTNGCFAQTGFSSDLLNRPENVTYSFACDYDGDGFIGDISNVNTTIQNLSMEKVNETYMFKDKNNTLFEFEINLTNSSINLGNLQIEKQSNESTFAYMLIRGLDLTSQNKTKTAYLDKILGGTGLCIKDEEFSSISEVSSECNGENETWIACPGIIGDYSCNLTSNETQYVITGLKHSGVKEQSTFCGDNVCNGAESCSVCSLDCGGCPPSGGGGGGGGGGGSGGGGGGGSVSTVNKQVVNNETIPSGGDNGSEGNETFAPTGENPVQDQPRSVWQRVVNFFRGGSPTNPSITGAVVGAGEGSGGRNSFMLIALVVVLGIAGILIWHKQKKKKLVEKANSKE